MEDSIISQFETGKIDVVGWLREQEAESIRSRIVKRVPANLDVTQGSYEWDAIEPTVLEFAVSYFMLQQAIELAFPQTSYGDWLKMHAYSRGVNPLAATYASGELTIAGVKGTVIPVGAKFSTTITSGSVLSPKYYTTLEERVVDETGHITSPVQADEVGTAGNVIAGEVNLNIQSIPGVLTVTNEQAITNGVDEESDEALLSRLLERIQNPPSSGAKSDYIRWAKEVPGVGDVIVQPIWDGPGTVKVIIIGVNGEPVPDLVKIVKNYIDPPLSGTGEGKAPIGATVTVTTIASKFIFVVIPNIVLEIGYAIENISGPILSALKKYIISIPANGIVRVKEMEAVINAVPGVLDFGNIRLNGLCENIQLSGDEKAAIKEVQYV